MRRRSVVLARLTAILSIAALLLAAAPALAYADDDAPEVTRGQWIHELVELFDVTVEEENYPEDYFSDVESGDAYYQDLVKAVEFGIIDVPAGGEVRANDAATRDFAAHTLNFCLGFQLQDEQYAFSDAGDCEHPDDAQVAVDRGWFALSEGAFLPERELTATERDAALADEATAYRAERQQHRCVVSASDGREATTEAIAFSIVS